MDNIDFNGKMYDLHSFTGTVINASKRSETVYKKSNSHIRDDGHITTRHVSETTIFDDIVVRNNLGKEHQLRLINWDYSCGVGNEIRFFWIDHKSTILFNHHPNDKLYLAAKNYTTDEVQYDENGIGAFFYIGYHELSWVRLFYISVFVLCIFIVGLILLSKLMESWFLASIILSVASIFFHIKYCRMAQDNVERIKHELYRRM